MVAALWGTAAQLTAKMERMKAAEVKLLQLARNFGDREGYTYKISSFDTTISSQNIPLKHCDNEKEFQLHAIHIQNTAKNKEEGTSTTKIPLVMQHGYMNSAAYFYRNLVGLSRYFESVYSLDMLGWGLSSRPDFVLADSEDEIKTAELFFVESLEAWRAENKIEKMILCGHSLGGYMSVAYCEKYPERVERLVLLSPVGVPEETEDTIKRREAMRKASWRFWAFSGLATNVFQYHSAGKALRAMPEKAGLGMWKSYVEKRLPAIQDPDEQAAISEYLYSNNTLPGSGEHCVNKVLNPYAYAKRPTEFRIPELDVKNVTFLYGSSDWMDPRGGTVVQLKCKARKEQQQPAPDVDVYELSRAGHLLMLENWQEFNAAVILGAGGSKDLLPQHWSLPTKLEPSDFVKDQHESWQRSSSSMQHQSTSSLSEASGGDNNNNTNRSGPQLAD